MTILIFLAVLVVLILVHEFGHFIVAKRFGIRVDEFGIGFPPKIFGKKVGETEYTVNALPIGGFVRIWGEDPTQEHYTDGPDRERSFVSKPRVVQAAVLVAGVAMNVLLAFVLYTGTFLAGMPTQVDEAHPDPSVRDVRLLVTEVLVGSPAASALRPSDAIVAVRRGDVSLMGDAVRSPKAVADLVASGADSGVVLTVLRHGAELDVPIAPVRGLIPNDPGRAAAGFTMSLVGTKQLSLGEALTQASLRTVFTIRDIAYGLGELAWGAVRGTADLSQVAGPVGIVNLVGDAAALGFTWLLTFSAFISLNLAVINLLPIPALDGGRLLFVFIEVLLRRPITPRIATRVNQVGFIALLALMALVTVHDIVRLWG